MDKDLLYNFYKGKVSIEEGQRVKAWIEASDENERAFYRERKIFDALMLNNPLPVKKTSFFNFTHYKKIEWLKIAMTVILTFLLSYFYQEYKAGLDSVAMSTISVPEGQRTNVTLPDGSNVWLNACTTIQYPTSFNSRERFVILKGEAYFDVKKNKSRPFIVHTDAYSIEVLGTKFNISNYKGRATNIVLVEGSVEVTDRNERKAQLVPSDLLNIANGAIAYQKQVDVAEYISWVDGVMLLNGNDLSHIIQKLSIYYGIPIQCDPMVGKEKVYGKLDLKDDIDEVIECIRQTIPIEVEKSDTSIYLSK